VKKGETEEAQRWKRQ